MYERGIGCRNSANDVTTELSYEPNCISPTAESHESEQQLTVVIVIGTMVKGVEGGIPFLS